VSGQGRVFLVGFMGAGKTSIGRLLAEELGYQFVDLDELIESRAGQSVRDIFTLRGEAEFRALESEAVEWCERLYDVVVALGGGAYESELNRECLRKLGTTFWLDCPLEICLARSAGDKSRPLLGDPREMRVLMERRRPNYSLADFVVDTGSQLPDEAVEAILDQLDSEE
jgi:shikimate kinase